MDLKDLFGFLKQAKWFLVSVVLITIIITFFITLLIIMHNNKQMELLEKEKITKQEQVGHLLNLLDPPVSYDLEVDEGVFIEYSEDKIIDDFNQGVIKNTDIIKYFKFEDFSSSIDFYYKDKILENWVDEIFEKY